MKIFSGSSNPKLSEEICKYLTSVAIYSNTGRVYLHTFPSGERYCQFKENIRGEDVFLIQSGSFPTNDNLMELLVMVDAARRASAKTITAVLPYSFYSRQDRKEKARVPISAKLVMNMLECAGVNRVLTMDLHAIQSVGFADYPVDHLYFEPVLYDYLSIAYPHSVLRNMVVVAPDAGAIKKGLSLSERLNCGFAFISKTRTGDTTVEINNFVGDVKDKTVIVIDDLTESCGTLIQAAMECKQRGAKKVICVVTHFCITEVGMDRLIQNMPHRNGIGVERPIDILIHSNTVDTKWTDSCFYTEKNLIKLSVGEIFGKAIRNINENKSVSELF